MPSHAVQGAIHLSFSDSYLCDARLPISDFCCGRVKGTIRAYQARNRRFGR